MIPSNQATKMGPLHFAVKLEGYRNLPEALTSLWCRETSKLMLVIVINHEPVSVLRSKKYSMKIR